MYIHVMMKLILLSLADKDYIEGNSYSVHMFITEDIFDHEYQIELADVACFSILGQFSECIIQPLPIKENAVTQHWET